MPVKTLSKSKFNEFISNLVKSERVIGVRKKENKFTFDEIKSADELMMDYDVTLRSPRAFFSPPREKLFDFSIDGKAEVTPTVDSRPFVIVGMHTYDLKALNQMDRIWAENNSDQHYDARRKAATIIALEPTRASEWSFWASMDAGTVKGGYDLLLTDIGDKYVIEIGTQKGQNILSKFTSAEDAGDSDLKARDRARASQKDMCRSERRINLDAKKITEALRRAYEHPIWEKQAEKCYSCGSCNLVCPTCYCFNVSDSLELDLAHGDRSRRWDGCLLDAFAKVGSGENFREHRADRFRHRILRKTVYIADKLGGELACVGCGRCSSVCLPDITDPVKIINEIAK